MHDSILDFITVDSKGRFMIVKKKKKEKKNLLHLKNRNGYTLFKIVEYMYYHTTCTSLVSIKLCKCIVNVES